MDKLSDATGKYGAQMGRPSNQSDASLAVVFEVERLTSKNDAYDAGGAYWGLGDPVYRAVGTSEAGPESITVRAANMKAAKSAILALYPKATFDSSADLDAFFSGYRDASLFSTRNSKYEDNPEEEQEMLNDTGYAVSEETLAAFRQDCEAFMSTNADTLTDVISDAYTLEHAGHDFWLTRNGHGSGYWSRDLGEPGEKLSNSASSFGEDDLWVDDDNVIRSESENRISAAPGI